MQARFSIILFMLFALLVFVVACAPPPTPRVEPTRAPATARPPGATTQVAPTLAVPATSTPVYVDESDCRPSCHIPDPNEEFANGAMPQPVNHADYKTCVECHIKVTKPALPETHRGRMDPACPLCHTREAKTK